MHHMVRIPKVATILLDYGANLNIRTNWYVSGLTPLTSMLRIGPQQFTKDDEEIVRLMLRNGNTINFNIRFKGQTALEMALDKGYDRIVKMILYSS